MGGVLSILVDLVQLLPELSASTGFGIEAILAGEAAASVEAEVTGLMLLESLGPLDALASLGLSAESFSLLSAMPGFFQDVVGLGVLFQTISGASSLVAAGIQLRHEVSVVNRNMALVPWIPHDLFDIYFPGAMTFSRVINVIADWGVSLFEQLSRTFWDELSRQSRAQIESAAREVALRGAQTFADTLSRVIERARWTITNSPIVQAYGALEDYYRRLPQINPPQARQLFRRLGERPPDRYNLEQLEREARAEIRQEESGEVVERYEPPGGAFQRSTPDWMLPLILGLYGDITPTWSAYIEQIEAEEDGPKKKRRRQ